MRAGELRHQIALQVRASTQDTAGGQTLAWTTILTAWAAVVPLSGRELLNAQAVNSETTHQITLRYDAVFADPRTASAYRVLYGTRVFDVRAVLNEDERNRMVTLHAVENMAPG